jgi:hypothetical protein
MNFKAFCKLNEDMTSSTALGNVAYISNTDSYAPGDARIPKILGAKKRKKKYNKSK